MYNMGEIQNPMCCIMIFCFLLFRKITVRLWLVVMFHSIIVFVSLKILLSQITQKITGLMMKKMIHLIKDSHSM